MKSSVSEKAYIKQSIEITIRLVLVFILLWYCFKIISPFISSLLWGIITAVALSPVFSFLKKKLNFSDVSIAVIITLLSLLLFAIPFYLLMNSLIEEFHYLAAKFTSNEFSIPALPESVAGWPIVGKKISSFWNMASKNIDDFLMTYNEQFNSLGKWLLSTVIDLISGVFHFILSIFFAGVLLAYSKQSSKIAHQLFIRIAGKHGEAFSTITEKTIMSVTKGVLGVAIIQGALASIGFFMVGMPGAGILTLLCVLFSTIQIGLIPVILPVIIYSFYTYSSFVAVSLCVWLILVSLVDNILKPMLLGKGAAVPMPVIFIRVIGGFISFGIVGMFIGSVLFSIGYILFLIWLNDNSASTTRMHSIKKRIS